MKAQSPVTMQIHPVTIFLSSAISLLIVAGVQTDVMAKSSSKSKSAKASHTRKTSKKYKKTKKRKRRRKKAHKRIKLVPPPPPVAPSILPELAYSRKSQKPEAIVEEQPEENPYGKYIYYQDNSQAPSRVVKSKYVTVYSR